MGPLGPLRQRLAEGQATLGYLVTTASVQIVQALARTGVDSLMIDMEHAPVGIESVAAMIAATAGTPVTPIVRVPAPRIILTCARSSPRRRRRSSRTAKSRSAASRSRPTTRGR